MNVGNKIKQLRLARSLSQYRLAKLAGVAQSFIHEVESGQKSPTVRTLAKLAGALGVTVARLVDDNSLDPTGTEGRCN